MARNPQDTTLRNVRAANKRIEKLEKETKAQRNYLGLAFALLNLLAKASEVRIPKKLRKQIKKAKR